MPRCADAPRLIVAPHPCTFERFDRLVVEGATVAGALAELGLAEAPALAVHVDGEPVPRERWADTVLRNGQLVVVRVIPQGGGNGAKVARTVLVLAVIAAAAVTGGAAAGLFPAGSMLGLAVGAVAATAVGYAGMLAVNALVPLPMERIQGGALDIERLPSVLAGRNALPRYRPVPRIYGTRKIYPAHGALPYTEIVGSDQYLVQAFCLGYGPLQVTDIKIGDTPITSFTDVEYEVLQGYDTDPAPTLYTNDVFEEAPGATLIEAAAATVRTSQPGAEEISLDITFPAGLIWYENNGDKHSIEAVFQIEFAETGTGVWQTPTFVRKTEGLTEPAPGQVAIEATRAETLRIGVSFRPPTPGQYDVRVQYVSATRHSTSDDQAIGVDVSGTEPVWTALRSIKATNPIQKTGLAWIFVRIKATDQLQGVVDRLSCMVTSILPVWDGAAWTEQATRNPAWAYCDVLRGAANRRALADTRLDLDAIKGWADLCAANGWYLDAEINQPTTVWQVLHDICAVGRAAFVVRDGRYSVAPDVEQTVPVQHFTPRNSWGWRTTRVFTDPPHALRMRFIDSSTWQQAERVVYADGYDETTASVYDEVELWGVTDADQAWKAGRYFLAVGRLRPEVHELYVDVEHLVCQVGDLVRVTHDVPLWGVSAARITAVTVDGLGQVTAITLDELVPMEAGKTYALRVRKSDLSEVTATVQTVAGETDTLTLSAPVTGPEVGDLVLFGESGSESVECLVKSVDPGPELSARLTLVEHAPAVYQADQGAVPTWDPKITQPIDVTEKAPPAPTVIAAQAEAYLHDWTTGQLVPRIVVTVAPPGGYTETITHIEAQYRLAPPAEGAGPWKSAGLQPAGSLTAVVAPVEGGKTYEVRVRWVTRLGMTSGWVYTGAITVQQDTTAPATPTGLLTRFTDRVVCSWTRGTDPDLSHYLVSVDGGATWTPTSDTSIEIVNPDSRSYTFQVKAVDRTGNESAAAQATSTKPEPPAPTAGQIRIESNGLTVTATVTSLYTPADGHQGFVFEYRYSGAVDWTVINDLPSDVVAWSAPSAGTIEVRAKAVDQIGVSALATDPPATAVLTLLDASEIAYADGTPVENLKPAEAGADVTGANTAADTSAVAGTAAATVKTWAANGDAAYDGTVLYRTPGAPTNPPVPTGITTELTDSGSMRAVLTWAAYTQGANQADMIIVYVAKNTGVNTNTPWAACNPSGAATSFVIDGLDPTAMWSFGVAAARRTENGLEVGAIQSPASAPDWTYVSLGSPNFVGTLEGTPIATVKSQAADGSTAFSETTLYRSPGAPTNAPVPSDITSDYGKDGSITVTLHWSTYIQGALQADLLLLFWRSGLTGPGAPTVTDPCVAVSPGATSHTFGGLPPDLYHSFGIAAARRTENGLEIGAIQVPTTIPNWVDRYWGTPNFRGNIEGTAASTVKARADTGWDLTQDSPTVIHPSSVAAVDLGSGQVGTDPLTTVRDTAAAAHSGTTNYRTTGVPTNNPTPSSIALTANPDGSYDITISWAAYTQGARQADVLGVFWRSGSAAPGTPTYSDRLAECPLRAGYGGSFTLAGADPTRWYSFAIAAGRRTENGVEWGALQAPLSAPDWIDVQPAAEPDFQGTVGGVDAGQVAAYVEVTSGTFQDLLYSGQDLLDAVAALPRNLNHDVSLLIMNDITLPSRCLIEDLHGTGKLYIRSNDLAVNRIITCPADDDGIVVRSCTLPIEFWSLGWHVMGSTRAGLYVQDNPGHVYVYDAHFSRGALAYNTYGIRARRSPTVWASACIDRAGYDPVHYGLYADVASCIYHSSAAFGGISYHQNVGIITGGVINPT